MDDSFHEICENCGRIRGAHFGKRCDPPEVNSSALFRAKASVTAQARTLTKDDPKGVYLFRENMPDGSTRDFAAIFDGTFVLYRDGDTLPRRLIALSGPLLTPSQFASQPEQVRRAEIEKAAVDVLHELDMNGYDINSLLATTVKHLRELLQPKPAFVAPPMPEMRLWRHRTSGTAFWGHEFEGKVYSWGRAWNFVSDLEEIDSSGLPIAKGEA